MGTDTVETAAHAESIPQLITIQKGILALTRQWKNILYMPQLSQYNFKTKKHRPYTVSFATPDDTGIGGDDINDDLVSVDLRFEDEKASLFDEDLDRSAPPHRYGDAAQESLPNVEVTRASSAASGYGRPKRTHHHQVSQSIS